MPLRNSGLTKLNTVNEKFLILTAQTSMLAFYGGICFNGLLSESRDIPALLPNYDIFM